MRLDPTYRGFCHRFCERVALTMATSPNKSLHRFLMKRRDKTWKHARSEILWILCVWFSMTHLLNRLGAAWPHGGQTSRCQGCLPFSWLCSWKIFRKLMVDDSLRIACLDLPMSPGIVQAITEGNYRPNPSADTFSVPGQSKMTSQCDNLEKLWTSEPYQRLRQVFGAVMCKIHGNFEALRLLWRLQQSIS